ncbi:MAG: Ig-like domain-containing protein [Spirochaetes bacterium]|nr:Ig-like domain-containing protein [Spirochaetota bacterium]
MKANVYVVMLTLMIFFSCGYDITPPRIVSYIPGNGTSAPTSTSIQITFSKTMNKDITQKAFSLMYGETESIHINGKFEWSDSNQIMTFIPEKELIPGYYRIIVDKTACDTHNNTLVTQHLSRFYAGFDYTNPSVTNSSPQDGALNIPLNAIITIHFSEPMNIQSVQKNIRISPAFGYTVLWDNQFTTLILYPHEPLLFNTWYSITIPTNCTDIAGNSILNQYEFRFKTGTEYVRPQITGIYTTSIAENMAQALNFTIFEGANINDELILQFSEPVDESTLLNALIINPAVSWQPLWNTLYTSCTIRFAQSLQPNTQYELLLTTSLKDKAGNFLSDNRCIYFITNGPLSQRPEIIHVVCNETVNGQVQLGPYSQINNLGQELTVQNNSYTFTITFSMDILRNSVPDNVRIEYLHGEQPEMSGNIRSFQWGSSRILTLTIAAIEGGNVYKLTVKGGDSGITAYTGIPLKENMNYIFYFEPQD